MERILPLEERLACGLVSRIFFMQDLAAASIDGELSMRADLVDLAVDALADRVDAVVSHGQDDILQLSVREDAVDDRDRGLDAQGRSFSADRRPMAARTVYEATARSRCAVTRSTRALSNPCCALSTSSVVR